MTSPRALLVDLDDTAYAYAPGHRAGLAAAAALAAALDPAWSTAAAFESDYAAARRAVQARSGPTAASHSRLLYFKRMIEARVGVTRADPIARLDDAYWTGYLAAIAPAAGCREVLTALADRGTRLAWVTNFTTARQLDKLARLGLADLPALLVTSEEAGAEKPDPAVVVLALERLGVAADHAWLAGDDPRCDVGAAVAAGVTAVLLRADGASAPGARHAVRSWPELGSLLGVA